MVRKQKGIWYLGAALSAVLNHPRTTHMAHMIAIAQAPICH
jgi:hypothetical protein